MGLRRDFGWACAECPDVTLGVPGALTRCHRGLMDSSRVSHVHLRREGAGRPGRMGER